MLQQIGLQFTNRCHGHCVMCDNRLSTRQPKYMTPEQLSKVVDEIAAIGANGRKAATGVCGDGEAVFHPDFAEMIPIVAEKLHWCFGSNCHAMNPEKTKVVLDNKPCVVSLSIDAVTGTTMKKIRPGVDFATAVHNALVFVEEVKKRTAWDRNFYIQFVVMKQNVHELPQWIDFWMPKIHKVDGFKLHVKPVFRWPRIPSDEAHSFWPSPTLPEIPSHPQIQVDQMTYSPVRPTCRLLWNFAWVMSDGSYNPCCMCADDVWKVGNVFETSLSECYKSRKLESYRRLQEQKEWDKLPLCGSCT